MDREDDRSISTVFLERAEEFLSSATITAERSAAAMTEPVLHLGRVDGLSQGEARVDSQIS